MLIELSIHYRFGILKLVINKSSKWLAGRVPISFVTDEFVRYLAVGFTTVGLDYALFTALFSFVGLPYLVAQLIGGAFVFVFNFTTHRLITFRKKGGDAKEKQGELTRYLVLTTWNYVASAGMLYIFVDLVGLHPLIAKAVNIGVIVSWNFVLLSRFVYRTHLVGRR